VTSPVSVQRRLFVAILVVTPFILLLLAEGALRVFSYGEKLDPVLRTTIRGREFFSVNRAVGHRYFIQPGVAVPEPPDALFPVVKSLRTRRIFCLGESTMAGFPYEYNATPASLLKDQLSALLPADTIEVINIGMSAVGSTVVRDLIGDLVQFEPDLFVIYVGHNEYYGVFGPGSSSPLADAGWLTQVHLAMMRTRVYLLLRDGYALLQRTIHTGTPESSATLMEGMVGHGEITYGSALYLQGLRNYRENIEAILSTAERHHVPVLFSALVSNLRDQPPFVSTFASGLDEGQKDRIRRTLDEGDSSLRSGAFAPAIASYRLVVNIDSLHAAGYFGVARALEAAGDTAGALHAFQRAKDLDALRFRASEELQRALIDICQQHGTTIARVDSAFASASPHGIIGRTMILEHLHPNIHGYMLMAKTWAEAIRTHGLLTPSGPWGSLLPDSLCGPRASITSFDEAIGRIKTAQLTRRWPFTPDVSRAESDPSDTVTIIVRNALRDHVAWTRARYTVAEMYERHREFDKARIEYAAIAKALPYSFQPVVRMADAFAAEGLTAEAIAGYRRSIQVEENPYAHMKLGVIMLQNGDAAVATGELERGFVVDAALNGSMTTGEQAFGRSLLAYAYARSGRYAEAKENARRALTLQPGLREAAELLRRLP
jgi:tetratricopeptide (TPR) repeat protein